MGLRLDVLDILVLVLRVCRAEIYHWQVEQGGGGREGEEDQLRRAEWIKQKEGGMEGGSVVSFL